MATIDTSIYNNLQPVKINSPFENAAMLSQIQQGQNQNKLSQMAFAEKDRQESERNALAGAWKGAVGADGNIDYNRLTGSLATGGFGDKVPGLLKQRDEQLAAGVELKNKTLTGQKLQGDIAEADRVKSAQRLTALRGQPYQAVVQDMQAGLMEAVAAGKMTQEQAQQTYQTMLPRIPQDQAQLDAWIDQTVKSVMTPQQIFESGQKATEFDYRKQHDAETLAQQERTSLRTDTRARDFNATKEDENTLKREAKADTAKLTQSSQIASFDTMLGTLDRLSKHPGLARSVGVTGMFPTMPGSDSANFQAELNSFQSQAFIPMVSQLKGMGALSDAEGKKLTAAVGALDPKMGEAAFRESVARITADMNAARARVAGSAQEKQPAKLKVATDYLNGAKDQADFAKRVKALKAKGWSDDRIRQAYGQ